MQAHNQWAARPNDERFKTVEELHAHCLKYRQSSVEAFAQTSSLRVEAVDGNLQLVGKDKKAEFTNWSFSQLCSQASAPAAYLQKLPATLAAQNLNHGLKEIEPGKDSALLLGQENGALTLRATVSEKYSRIWNSEITERLLRLQSENPNWKNPLAYKRGPRGEWLSEMEPAGLYASDRDMFAFLVDESKTFDGGPKGLSRGFFVANSEVGSAAYKFTGFLYDYVCGNNIVWGAENVFDIKIRHVGQAHDKAFSQLRVEIKKYLEDGTEKVERMIVGAKNYELGLKKEDVLDAVMGLAGKQKLRELTKVRVSEAIDTAEKRQDRYGSPNTLWAVVGGLTENSQNVKFADEKTAIDTAAGKLLKVITF